MVCAARSISNSKDRSARPACRPFVAIGGAVAAIADLAYAFASYGYGGASPLRILQSIASGLLGSRSFRGGLSTGVPGLLLHFAIAIAAAFFFHGVASRVRWLVDHWFVSGVLFGLGMYAFMNVVVVPLSAFPGKVSFPPAVLVSRLLAHAFLVGVPIAWSVQHAVGAGREPTHGSRV